MTTKAPGIVWRDSKHQQENVKDAVQVILTEEEILGALGFVGILKR